MITLAWTLLAIQIVLVAAYILLRYRPTLFYRMAPDVLLLDEGRWNECDGEPMNTAAIEWDRRHGAL